MPSKEIMEFLESAYSKRTGRNIPWEPDDEQMIRYYLRLGFSHDDIQQAFLGILQSGKLDGATIRPQAEFFLTFAGYKWSANCHPRCHIQAGYYGIYDFACALSAKSPDKTCWLSSRVTARWCNIDKDTAAAGIQWLINHEWLLPRGEGTLNRRLYEVVEHDFWVAARNRLPDGFWEPCVFVKDTDEE